MLTLQKTQLCAQDTEMHESKELDGRGIPFHLVRELFLFCEYGSVCSIAIKLLFYTGCRISELDNMQKSKIHNCYVYWNLGKNQTGKWRKEYLPDYFIAELEYYWKRNRTPIDRVVGVSHETFTRYWRRDIRPHLSPEWQEMTPVLNGGELEDTRKYVLKGFRKNFATLLFAHFWKKYGDANFAAGRVSKRMKHSSKHITADHYIDTLEQIDAKKYENLMPFEVVEEIIQHRIMDYC